MTEFATFWHGSKTLPNYELACLKSFAAQGSPITIFSYDDLDLPEWISSANARDLAPQEEMKRFVLNGKPVLAHFSDYLRIQMFKKTDFVWVDTDIVLLREPDIDLSGNVMGQDTADGVCNAVLHLDRNDPRLAEIDALVYKLADTATRYCDTGPRALKMTYGLAEALPGDYFYPVRYKDYFKLLLPEYRDWCEERCQDAYMLHLWNDMLRGLGLLKWVGPPEGSFLHSLFMKTGGIEFFESCYPAETMRTLVNNAVHRVGADAGVRKSLELLSSALTHSLRRRKAAASLKSLGNPKPRGVVKKKS